GGGERQGPGKARPARAARSARVGGDVRLGRGRPSLRIARGRAAAGVAGGRGRLAPERARRGGGGDRPRRSGAGARGAIDLAAGTRRRRYRATVLPRRWRCGASGARGGGTVRRSGVCGGTFGPVRLRSLAVPARAR